MSTILRPFTPDDLPGWVTLAAAVQPDYRQSLEEATHEYRSWDETAYFRHRLVVEGDDGALIGRGSLHHMPDQFHPDKYEVEVETDPEHRRRGIGSVLYDAFQAEFRRRGAIAVRCQYRENDRAAEVFATKRGFVVAQWEWESRLAVPTFDFGRFGGAHERATASGITFTTLAAERARDANALRAAYELHLACDHDVPSVDPVTPIPFELFLSQEIDSPDALPDGYFLALDGDRCIGMSSLFASAEAPGVIYQGLTGILPEYRKRGIALALKLLTVRYASEHGFHEIRTWNDSRNQPMLRINEAMGFVRQPAWLVGVKDLRAEREGGA